MFLKAHPDLLRSLEREIPREAHRAENVKDKHNRTKSHWQKQLAEATTKSEKLKHKYLLDPALREIQHKFMESVEVEKGSKSLVCPVCGSGDMGNRMNGKPWCFKCNSPLSKDKMARQLKSLRTRVLPKRLKDEFKRRGLDF